VSLTQGLSDQAVTSRPGSGWCRSSIRAGVENGSAASANKAIDRDEMIEPSVNGRTGSENNETLPAMLLRAVCRSICGPHAF
jgi:hypothetical protein